MAEHLFYLSIHSRYRRQTSMIHDIALYGSAVITAILFVGIAFGLEGLSK